MLPCHLARARRHAWQSILCNIPLPLHNKAAHQRVMVPAFPILQGKVLIDATNPLSPFPALEVRWGSKSGETLTLSASEASLPGHFSLHTGVSYVAALGCERLRCTKPPFPSAPSPWPTGPTDSSPHTPPWPTEAFIHSFPTNLTGSLWPLAHDPSQAASCWRRPCRRPTSSSPSTPSAQSTWSSLVGRESQASN